MFLDRVGSYSAFAKAESTVPQNGQLHDQLTGYVNDHPIIDFVSDTLAAELRDLDQYQSVKPVLKLTEIDGYRDPRPVAESLVARLESLPWQYVLTIKLPDPVSALFCKAFASFDLSATSRIVANNPKFAACFPLTSANKKRERRIHGHTLLGLAIPTSLEWENEAAYLQVEASGFIGLYGGSLPEFNARRLLRSFAGLGLALRLFQVERSYRPFLPKSALYVHRHEAEKWEIDNKLELTDDETQLFNDLRLCTLENYLDSDAKQIAWAVAKLEEMKSVFSAGERGESILLASQWLFDSYSGRDDLLNYIQAMVVLEILLGDKATSDEVGLGELLRNRCAYLIGGSREQRSEVLKEFNDIYRVRSQIVHRGKHRLNAHERYLFGKLHWMCRRVIQEELRLLRA